MAGLLEKEPNQRLERWSLFRRGRGAVYCNVSVEEAGITPLSELVQELVDYRLTTYAARVNLPSATVHALPNRPEQIELAFFLA